MTDFPVNDTFGEDLVDTDLKTEHPRRFKVILHNDGFTTMEFVVFILNHVFLRSESEATAIMLQVHQNGVGIAGVYPLEVARMKADKTNNLARARQFPLLCTIEEE